MSYVYTSSEPPDDTASYLMSAVLHSLRAFPPPRPLFELGCGNGAKAKQLAALGYAVTGVDPSESGIRLAQDDRCTFAVGSAYDDLAALYGQFDVVLSLEVVEHLFDPRHFARTVASLLTKDGIAIISTPYHGYLKNLALAVTGRLDEHLGPLWDGGHIKFWNRAQLAQIFREVGLREIGFQRVGRIPPLAKSMVCVYGRASSPSV